MATEFSKLDLIDDRTKALVSGFCIDLDDKNTTLDIPKQIASICTLYYLVFEQYINQLSTGISLSRLVYEDNKEKYLSLITRICKGDVYLEQLDATNKTPLANAITANLIKIAGILLKHGADINHISVKSAITSCDNWGYRNRVKMILGKFRLAALRAIVEALQTNYAIMHEETTISYIILNSILSEYDNGVIIDDID